MVEQYPDWRIAAARIGRSTDRRSGVLVGGLPLDDTSELAYYVWCIKDPSGDVLVVDAGFRPETGAVRTIFDSRPVATALRDIGVEPSSVHVVVLTHLHWDHMGDFAAFPQARFVVGRQEWQWTEERRVQPGTMFDEAYDRDALAAFADVDQDRLELVDDTWRWRENTLVSIVGGHTEGHAVVETELATGRRLMLLGDLAYLYRNLALHSAPLTGLDRWRTRDLYEQLASAGRDLVPGHDPAVLDRLGERVHEHVAVTR